MITKFETGQLASPSGNAGGKDNTLLYFMVGMVAIYFVFKYINRKNEVLPAEPEKQRT
jgi:hypothetical protein